MTPNAEAVPVRAHVENLRVRLRARKGRFELAAILDNSDGAPGRGVSAGDQAFIDVARTAIEAWFDHAGPTASYDLVEAIDQVSPVPRSFIQLAFHQMLDEGVLQEDELTRVRLQRRAGDPARG